MLNDSDPWSPSSTLTPPSTCSIVAMTLSRMVLCLAAVVLLSSRLAWTLEAGAASPPPTVPTECGPVSGTVNGSVHAFRGIPFGAPPTGERRWMPPEGLSQAGQCWAGTLAADDFADGCVQQGVGAAVYGNEDCLYLNVWKPATATATSNLPVLVFIYGGSLVIGDTRWYPQGRLAATGDVVAVSINYRLNGFGFMTLETLAERDPRHVSGNYGFLDQQLGLQWVQDNIAAFGGDPSRVTVWGQSSGGTSVLALLASPASKGLFSGVISLSGSPNITASGAVANRQNLGFITQAGCDGQADTAACLLALDAQQVFDALPSDVWGGAAEEGQSGLPTSPHGFGYPAYAVVDGVTVVLPVEQALEQGLVDVPLMVGSMAQELDNGPLVVVFNDTDAQYKAFLEHHFATWPGMAEDLLSLYAADLATNPQKAYDTSGTDAAMTCGNFELARAAARGFNSPVYSFVNNYEPSFPFPTQFGGYAAHYSFHELDMMAGLAGWSWFHDYEDPPKPPPYKPSPRDEAYGEEMRRTWIELAATGSLKRLGWKQVSDTPAWPSSYVSVLLNTTVTPVQDLRVKYCDFWAQHGGKGQWWTN